MVVEPDADAGIDTLDTDAGVIDLAAELAVMIVFVVVGVFEVTGVLAAGVFCNVTHNQNVRKQTCSYSHPFTATFIRLQHAVASSSEY